MFSSERLRFFIKRSYPCLSPCWHRGTEVELVSSLKSKPLLRGKRRRATAWCLRPLMGLMMAMPPLREDFTYIPSAAIHHADQYIIITRRRTLMVLTTWIKRHRHHLEHPVNSGRGLSVLVQPGLTNVCSAAVISSCPARLRCFMSVTFLSDGCSIIPGSSSRLEWSGVPVVFY